MMDISLSKKRRTKRDSAKNLSLITLCAIVRTLAYSIYDSTEEAIKKMIEASQEIINNQYNSSVVKRDFKLKIKTLQNAPRDPDKLKRLLQSKEKGEGRSNAHKRHRKVSY